MQKDGPCNCATSKLFPHRISKCALNKSSAFNPANTFRNLVNQADLAAMTGSGSKSTPPRTDSKPRTNSGGNSASSDVRESPQHSPAPSQSPVSQPARSDRKDDRVENEAIKTNYQPKPASIADSLMQEQASPFIPNTSSGSIDTASTATIVSSAENTNTNLREPTVGSEQSGTFATMASTESAPSAHMANGEHGGHPNVSVFPTATMVAEPEPVETEPTAVTATLAVSAPADLDVAEAYADVAVAVAVAAEAAPLSPGSPQPPPTKVSTPHTPEPGIYTATSPVLNTRTPAPAPAPAPTPAPAPAMSTASPKSAQSDGVGEEDLNAQCRCVTSKMFPHRVGKCSLRRATGAVSQSVAATTSTTTTTPRATSATPPPSSVDVSGERESSRTIATGSPVPPDNVYANTGPGEHDEDGADTNADNGNVSDGAPKDPPCRCATSALFPHRRSKCQARRTAKDVTSATKGVARGASKVVTKASGALKLDKVKIQRRLQGEESDTTNRRPHILLRVPNSQALPVVLQLLRTTVVFMLAVGGVLLGTVAAGSGLLQVLVWAVRALLLRR